MCLFYTANGSQQSDLICSLNKSFSTIFKTQTFFEKKPRIKSWGLNYMKKSHLKKQLPSAVTGHILRPNKSNCSFKLAISKAFFSWPHSQSKWPKPSQQSTRKHKSATCNTQNCCKELYFPIMLTAQQPACFPKERRKTLILASRQAASSLNFTKLQFLPL